VKPVAWYDSPTPLRSGWAWGQQYLDQAVSIIDAQVGKGRVVLFGNEVNCAGSRTARSSCCSTHLLRQRGDAGGSPGHRPA